MTTTRSKFIVVEHNATKARLDRFVDAITDIYEPTDQQGTIPGNEFKETAVGEDLK